VSSLESADHVDQGHLLRIYASHCGFLHFAETRHPLRSQAVELSQKIEFVFPASSETIRREHWEIDRPADTAMEALDADQHSTYGATQFVLQIDWAL